MMFSVSQSMSVTQQFILPRFHVRRKPIRYRHLLPPLFLFSTLLLQLWIRVGIIERGYTLETLREQALKRDTKLRELRLDYAYLSRPNLISHEAERKLGMSMLCPQRLRKLELSESITGREAAAPDSMRSHTNTLFQMN